MVNEIVEGELLLLEEGKMYFEPKFPYHASYQHLIQSWKKFWR